MCTFIWFVPVPLATASCGFQNQSAWRPHSSPAKGRDTDRALMGASHAIITVPERKKLEEIGIKDRRRSGFRKGAATVMLGRK